MKERTDREFLSDLYKDYCDYLAIIVKNIIFVNDADEILSCVHQVFVIALEKIDIVREHERVKYWLAKTASYVALEYNRKLRLDRYVDDTSLLDIIPSDNFFDDELIEDLIWQDYKDKDIWKYITSRLNKNENALLELLCTYSNDSMKIAESLRIPLSTLKTRKFRLKVKIKNILENFDQTNLILVILMFLGLSSIL